MHGTLFGGEDNELLAVVDVGSNSVRMNIYDVNVATGDFSVVSSVRSMLRLAAYVNDGILDPDGDGKLFSVMREYLARANSLPCDRFAAFATASLRGVRNAEKTVRRLRQKLGVELEIISGDDEARYDFIATTERLGAKMARRGVVIDMGGGSTEFIPFENGAALGTFSLPIGALSLWKRFCGARLKNPFPTQNEISDIERYVCAEMKNAAPLENFGGTAYLIGGTARALCRFDSIINEREFCADGYTASGAHFKTIRDDILSDAARGANTLYRVCSDRLTSIAQGAVAYAKIMETLAVENAVLGGAGVREGYVSEYIRKTLRKEARQA